MPLENGVLIASIKLRGDTAAALTSTDPVLLDREVCFETDSFTVVSGKRVYKFKVGPGQWNTLSYASLGNGGLTQAEVEALIATHAAATDPHGDRAYTDSKVAQEVTDRNAAIAAALVGLWDDRGNFDASGADAYPTTGGSGTGGVILKGDVWTVSVAGGTMDVGDIVRALVDAPGSTPTNWAVGEANVQQATESLRGTLKVAVQATVEDDTTTNDVDAVTPKKWWQAWTKGLTLANFFSAVRGTVLTAFDPTPGLVTASDSVESAIGKLVGNVNLNTSGISARALRLITINAQTGTTYTPVAGDGGPDKMLTLTNASAITCTIPPNASLAYPIGTVISGLQGGAGVVTLTPGSGVTLTSRGGALKTAGTGAFFSALKTATDTWFVTGDLTT